MRSPRGLAKALVALCVLAGVLALAPAAGAAVNHPVLFKVFNYINGAHPPVEQYFEDPCGVAVRSDGGIYVSDYYHDRVESFDRSGVYLDDALTGFDSADGPCGLAADGGNGLFVNDFHHSVVRYAELGSPQTIDSAEPTGVAYDPASDRVYVDDRSSVSVYEDSGAPVEVDGVPLRIGTGNIGDGYGVAVSDHPGQEGFVYVPDAATDTIKVFDPNTSLTDPVEEIDGAGSPEGGFKTLRDAAVAIDQATGHLFVVYNAEGPFYEHPHAAVAEFTPTGAYRGTLPRSVRFGEPSGIAVDNTGGPTQGRIFVTSGNDEVREPVKGPPDPSPGNPEEGAVFAFGPTAPGFELQVTTSGEGTVTSEPAGIACPGACAGEYDEGASVKLSAAAASGWEFAGWSGEGCSGTDDCTITLNAASQAVSAQFVSTTTPNGSPASPAASPLTPSSVAPPGGGAVAAAATPAAAVPAAGRSPRAAVGSAPGGAHAVPPHRHPRKSRHAHRREHRHGKSTRKVRRGGERR